METVNDRSKLQPKNDDGGRGGAVSETSNGLETAREKKKPTNRRKSLTKCSKGESIDVTSFFKSTSRQFSSITVNTFDINIFFYNS